MSGIDGVTKLTLLGSSSGRNLGDAALIDGIQSDVDRAFGETCQYLVPTIRPSYIKANYQPNVVPIRTMPWDLSVKLLGLPTYRAVSTSDATLIFDAVLFDRSLYNPLFNFMSSIRLMLPAAAARGKIIGCYNVTVGPISTVAGKRVLTDILNLSNFVAVRDQDSFDYVANEIDLGDTPLLLGADPAINARTDSRENSLLLLQAAGLDTSEPILGININRYLDTWADGTREAMGKEKFLEIYSKALDAVAAELGVQFLFVCTQVHDVGITRELIQRCRKLGRYGIVSAGSLNHVQMKGVLAQIDFLFAMRLHAVILSSSNTTPVSAIEYQPKVLHYLRSLGLADRCMTFRQFTTQSLTDEILRGWELRSETRAQLGQAIPRLSHMSRSIADFLVKIKSGTDMEIAAAEHEVST